MGGSDSFENKSSSSLGVNSNEASCSSVPNFPQSAEKSNFQYGSPLLRLDTSVISTLTNTSDSFLYISIISILMADATELPLLG